MNFQAFLKILNSYSSLTQMSWENKWRNLHNNFVGITDIMSYVLEVRLPQKYFSSEYSHGRTSISFIL